MRALFKQTVDKRVSNTDITIGEVKKAALGLISNVRPFCG